MGTRRLLFEGLSFAYWVVRRLFELLILFGRSERAKELEILILRHELQVLRRVGFANSGGVVFVDESTEEGPTT